MTYINIWNHSGDMWYHRDIHMILYIISDIWYTNYKLFYIIGQPDAKVDSECWPNSEREKKNRSGLLPRPLGPNKTSLNCLK